jgi:hypothetical protein
VAYPEILFREGGSKNSVEERGQRERGSGGGSPVFRVTIKFAKNETHILIRLLRMYIPRNWEFGSALAFGISGEGVEPPKPPSVRHCREGIQEKRGACRVLVGKPVEKRSFEIPGGRWKDNTRMDVNSAGRAWTEWRQMAGFCAHGNETSGCVKCGEFLD